VEEKTLHIKSSLSELASVRSEVLSFLGNDVPELWRGRIVLCIDEALSNVMRHGYLGAEDGDIELGMKRMPDGYSFLISDRAPEFNPLDKKKSENHNNDGVGGFGVDVYRRFMDAEYAARDQGGNLLTLSWRRTRDEDTVSG
jgi:serine/threonine-protein kinase RsbW